MREAGDKHRCFASKAYMFTSSMFYTYSYSAEPIKLVRLCGPQHSFFEKDIFFCFVEFEKIEMTFRVFGVFWAAY